MESICHNCGEQVQHGLVHYNNHKCNPILVDKLLQQKKFIEIWSNGFICQNDNPYLKLGVEIKKSHKELINKLLKK